MFKTFIYKIQLSLFLIGLCSFLISCYSENQMAKNKVSLNTWLEDKNNFVKLIRYLDGKKCDEAESVFFKFKTTQFKNQSFLQLARCFADDNNEKALLYLTEAIKVGYHIKLIDSILFNNVWDEVKIIYPKLNQKYWNHQDTTFFKEIEQLVYLDQKVRYDRPVGYDDYTAETKQDSISTKFLIEYCRKNGYPQIFYPSYFKDFRKIDPTILAIHAKDFYKKEILDCAIETAKTGRISWLTPIIITKSFYIVGKPLSAVHPLFMLHFDDDFNLQDEKSLLQLYSIQEQYGRDMPSKIILQPSLSNNHDILVIEKQLSQVKNILINEFLFDENQIAIDLVPSEEKVYDDFVESYLYTISAERL
jgi:hypothetical protein